MRTGLCRALNSQGITAAIPRGKLTDKLRKDLVSHSLHLLAKPGNPSANCTASQLLPVQVPHYKRVILAKVRAVVVVAVRSIKLAKLHANTRCYAMQPMRLHGTAVA